MERAWEEGGAAGMEKWCEQRVVSEERCMENKNIHMVSHTHTLLIGTICWQRNEQLNCLICFPSSLRWDGESGRDKGVECTHDCRWWSAMGNSASAALHGQVHSINSIQKRGLPSCEQGEFLHCGLQKDLHVSFTMVQRYQKKQQQQLTSQVTSQV